MSVIPGAAEEKSETVQRAEVKSFCSLVLDGSLAETLFRSLCTKDFNKRLVTLTPWKKITFPSVISSRTLC